MQLLSPLEGTELGLDQLSVRVRVKNDLGSGVGLDVFGVRISIRFRVGSGLGLGSWLGLGSGSQ